LKNGFIKSSTKKNTKKRISLSEYQDMEHYLAGRPMSDNDKIDILYAYWAYVDALKTLYACCRALERCGLPEEDPEYNNFKDALSEADSAYEIAKINYYAICDRLFR